MKKHMFYFYGNEVTITVTKEEKDVDYAKKFENWFNGEKKRAVEDYKDEMFLASLKRYE